MIAVAGTILLLNARYMLYGAALRPWLQGASSWTVYPALAVLGDGNWILSMKAHAEGERDAGYVLGSGLAMFIPWLGGSWIGLSAGGLIRNPDALALDFLLVSFSAAMGVGMFKGRGDLKIIGVAVLAAALADRFLISGSASFAPASPRPHGLAVLPRRGARGVSISRVPRLRPDRRFGGACLPARRLLDDAVRQDHTARRGGAAGHAARRDGGARPRPRSKAGWSRRWRCSPRPPR